MVALARQKTFTSLREARGFRDSAAKLSLADQKLSAVPGLVQLRYLQVLDLSHNNLSDVAGLAALSRLQRLDLSDNPLKRPPELSRLLELTELDLSQTELATLPFEVGKLQKLRILRVGSAHLRRIPDELTDAAALATFSLRGCSQLTSLPKEMGKLRSLTSLDLSGTQVPRAEVERVRALLPQVNIVGGSSEESGAPGVAEGESTSVAALVELGCAEVLRLEPREYLRPFAQEPESAELPSGLKEAAAHFEECALEHGAVTRAALEPALRTRLTVVGHALATFENARFDVARGAPGPNDAQMERERVVAQAERAAVMGKVVEALNASVREDADVAPAGASRVTRALEAASTAADRARSGDGSSGDFTALQDAADDVLRDLQGWPAPAQRLITQRMVELLK